MVSGQRWPWNSLSQGTDATAAMMAVIFCGELALSNVRACGQLSARRPFDVSTHPDALKKSPGQSANQAHQLHLQKLRLQLRGGPAAARLQGV